ncbi:MAG: hypothetical protein ABSA67_05365 [Candidatus Brocadiia bacterium]|jgi:hypothetical protein
MSRIAAFTALLILLAPSALFAQTPEGPGTWAFQPARDEFRPDALLDLRSLNEKQAGESGFVKVDANGDFVLGNGDPVRFWAVNTNVGRDKPFHARPLWSEAEPDLAHHARFLAKRGVNMVRLHAHLDPGPKGKLTEFDRAERDWIWRAVAAMKKEGIYATISPFWAEGSSVGPSWGIPGVTKEQSAASLLFFDPTMQEGYRAWLKALYAETNPYTGIPLAKDPAVAIIQLQNEDSLLFWTFNSIQGEQRRRLSRLFGDFLKSKYGSLDKAKPAWGGADNKDDDLADGVVALDNIWELTQERSGARARRLADMTEFLSRTMDDFNRKMEKFLREELGCKQLINAGNWQTADMVKLNDAERWSYTANQVLAVNRYFDGIHIGKNNGWAIENGDQFTSPSVLLEPRQLPVSLKLVKGFPMMVTESAWVMPDAHASEGPFLVAAYQSLSGVDAYFWFATDTDEWTPPQSANGYMPSQGKWLFANPDMLGGFPAAALMYRMGYVRRGEPVVHEERSLENIFQRRDPIIAEGAGFDPNRNSGNIAPDSSVKGGVNPLAFLAGRVEVVYGGQPQASKVADLKPFIDEPNKEVRSVTGELTFNYGKGFCLLNAPKAQGVAAFFKNRKDFKTDDVEIASDNDYGTVLVVSMDDKPIRESGKLLVQTTTQCRPTGWREKPVTIKVKEGTFPGFEVVNFGKAPWQVTRARVTLTIHNPSLAKATVLDANGNAAGEAKLERRGDEVEFRFPENALYVILQ